MTRRTRGSTTSSSSPATRSPPARTRATRSTARGTRSTRASRSTSRPTTPIRSTSLRWLSEGRDASATIDSAFGGFGKNDGDNETTGIHVSNGDPSVNGILGAQKPKLFHNEWRWFYTQQYGDNVTYEVLPAG